MRQIIHWQIPLFPVFLDRAPHQAANAVDFPHDQSCMDDDLLACRRYSNEPFPMAYKKPQAKLRFEQLELFAHAGLRRVKLIRGCCNVQVVVRNRKQVSELQYLQLSALLLYFILIRTTANVNPGRLVIGRGVNFRSFPIFMNSLSQPSFLPQRLRRLDSCGAPRRQPAGEQRSRAHDLLAEPGTPTQAAHQAQQIHAFSPYS
jgi:hypothetical protein